jgi:RNA polymerase primary sigma factor
MVDPEQIEDIIGMINGMGIEVHEVAPDAETLLLAGQAAAATARSTTPPPRKPPPR